MNVFQCWAIRTVLWSYPVRNLTRSEQDMIAEHIAHCPGCARDQMEFQAVGQLLISIGPVPVPDALLRNTMERSVMNAIKDRRFPSPAVYSRNLFSEIYEDLLQEPVASVLMFLFGIICGVLQFSFCFH